MNNKMLLGLAALAASTSLIAPTVARADSLSREAQSGQVSYADLDLTTERDQARLQTRIAAKLRRLCDSGTRDLRARVAQVECINEGRQQMERQVRLAVADQRTKTRRA